MRNRIGTSSLVRFLQNPMVAQSTHPVIRIKSESGGKKTTCCKRIPVPEPVHPQERLFVKANKNSSLAGSVSSSTQKTHQQKSKQKPNLITNVPVRHRSVIKLKNKHLSDQSQRRHLLLGCHSINDHLPSAAKEKEAAAAKNIKANAWRSAPANRELSALPPQERNDEHSPFPSQHSLDSAGIRSCGRGRCGHPVHPD
jgi:hypothetical protein